MTKLYSGAQVQRMDAEAIRSGTPGFELMKRAARAAFWCIVERWPNRELVVLCGAGNNAGDGYVIAALAKQNNIPVLIYSVKEPEELIGEAGQAVIYAKGAGVLMKSACTLIQDGFEMQNPVVVDALLGTGQVGNLRGWYINIIPWLNAQGLDVFSVDVPSGICCDSGFVMSAAVKANVTMSFIGRKKGLFTGDGREYSGNLLFHDLGVRSELIEKEPSHIQLLQPETLLARMSRNENAHKGTFGHVAVIGGGSGMGGAALMAAEAALISGAGVTSLFTRSEHVYAANVRVPEVMARGLESVQDFDGALSKSTSLCLGPGLGQNAWSRSVSREALKNEIPKAIDADALNLIALGELKLSGEQHVLTPHPGEAARLLKCSASDIQKDRYAAAEALQRQYGGVIVLKGAGSLVADRHGIYVCTCGNPGMAVGGMGDVLAGVIAALLAQGFSLLESAQLGVWVHSAAADLAVAKQGQIGLRATDLFIYIRSLLNGKKYIS